MTHSTIVATDIGFDPSAPRFEFAEPMPDLRAWNIPGHLRLDELPEGYAETEALRIEFGGYADGRGFTLAAQLRRSGYTGHLRAAGPLIADQYAMARRAGFDDVEVRSDIAKRQPNDQWIARANWQANSYQNRLKKMKDTPQLSPAGN